MDWTHSLKTLEQHHLDFALNGICRVSGRGVGLSRKCRTPEELEAKKVLV